MYAFNVRHDTRMIDRVYYGALPGRTIAEALRVVRDSLVNHDGHAVDIRVTWPKGQRVTETEYVIQGNYGAFGWEDVTAERTRKEAYARLREYRANEPQYLHRIITHKVRKS